MKLEIKNVKYAIKLLSVGLFLFAMYMAVMPKYYVVKIDYDYFQINIRPHFIVPLLLLIILWLNCAKNKQFIVLSIIAVIDSTFLFFVFPFRFIVETNKVFIWTALLLGYVLLAILFYSMLEIFKIESVKLFGFYKFSIFTLILFTGIAYVLDAFYDKGRFLIIIVGVIFVIALLCTVITTIAKELRVKSVNAVQY